MHQFIFTPVSWQCAHMLIYGMPNKIGYEILEEVWQRKFPYFIGMFKIPVHQPFVQFYRGRKCRARTFAKYHKFHNAIEKTPDIDVDTYLTFGNCAVVPMFHSIFSISDDILPLIISLLWCIFLINYVLVPLSLSLSGVHLSTFLLLSLTLCIFSTFIYYNTLSYYE